MKTLASIFLTSLVLLSTSCGIQKQYTTNSNTISSSSAIKNKDAVQTTFFGAKFGDEGQYSVKSTMSSNGIGHYWEPLQKNQWAAPNVEFAGRIWFATVIFFTDNKFSQIMFNEKVETKERGQEIFTELYQLLSQKYPLKKHSAPGLGDDLYVFMDSYKNMVSLNLKYSEEMDSWIISLYYGWGKANGIKEEKALNEI